MELKGALESIIYAADEPATLEQIAAAVAEEKDAVKSTLDEMIAGYAAEDRGVEIRAVAGGYKFYTKPQHHDVVRRFIKSLRPPLRLTMPALETLAVISYRQPVTGPEIQDIRGVNCSGVIKTLLEKRLITTAGRKAVMGRPIMYRTSKEFLMRFGLSDLEELPSLKEFEQLARAALGADEGIAAIEPEDLLVAESEADVAAGMETGADGDSENGPEVDGIPESADSEELEVFSDTAAATDASQEATESTSENANAPEPRQNEEVNSSPAETNGDSAQTKAESAS